MVNARTRNPERSFTVPVRHAILPCQKTKFNLKALSFPHGEDCTGLKPTGFGHKQPWPLILGVCLLDLKPVYDLILPEVTALGLDLVRVAWVSGDGDEPSLQIMAERPETRQLQIADCATLSRRISEKFDALEEAGTDPIPFAYRLEVSSPGIDRPLTRLSDYADWAGHEANIKLSELVEGRKGLRGELIGVEGDMALINDKKSGRVAFPLSAVESAKLMLTDKLIAATVPIAMEALDDFDEFDEDEIDDDLDGEDPLSGDA